MTIDDFISLAEAYCSVDDRVVDAIMAMLDMGASTAGDVANLVAEGRAETDAVEASYTLLQDLNQVGVNTYNLLDAVDAYLAQM